MIKNDATLNEEIDPKLVRVYKIFYAYSLMELRH